MPMGIVSDADFNDELSRVKPDDKGSASDSSNIVGRIRPIERGRPNGAVEVPNTLRRIIGDESVTNGRQSAIELASKFGISPSSVSAYAQGATSTASYDKRPNESVINSAKDRISIKARKKLMLALQHINDEKLSEAKVRDLAGIAKDMSAIVKNMEPNTNQPSVNNSGPNFIFYTPQFRKEESYEIVQSKE
jgi:hypothetical protein